MLRTSSASPEPCDPGDPPAFGEPIIPELPRQPRTTQVIGRPQHLPKGRPVPGDLLIVSGSGHRHPKVFQVVADVAWPHERLPADLPREGGEPGFYGLVRPVGGGAGGVALRRILDGEGRMPRGQWLVRLRKSASGEVDLAPWQDLLSCRPSPELQRAVGERGLSVARIEDASGPLAADRFAVHVRRLPDGLARSRVDLLGWMRLHLHELFPRDLCRIAAESEVDEARWRSGSPLGAVLRVDLIEEGRFLCVEHDRRHFRLVALRTPVPGDVFGASVREWGVTGHPAGGFEVYTRGVGRAGGWVYGKLPRPAHAVGETLWRCFQEGVARLVKEAGGDAEILAPLGQRVSWADAAPFHTPAIAWV
jgi:hypothetical protein